MSLARLYAGGLGAIYSLVALVGFLVAPEESAFAAFPDPCRGS